MNEQPAGWYPDPFAAVPGATRYWDGERWTSQAREPAPEPQSTPAGLDSQHFDHRGLDRQSPGSREPTSERSTGWGAAGQRPSGHPEGLPWASADRSGQVASWGARLGAYLLDMIPMVLVTIVLLWMTGVYDAVSTAMASGDAAAIDAATAMMTATHPAGLTITIANLAFVALYNIGFHASRGQTPGKMLLGIRVRRVDEDRNPDLKGASLRWFVQFGPNLLSGVALLGMLASLFSIADHLWPIWDRQGQAFHDKAGRTVVVRAR